MPNPLDRSPLTSTDGLTQGRQVKIGAAIEDARQLMTDYPLVPRDFAALGYKGTIDQILHRDSRFAVSIPEGTRGLISRVIGHTVTVGLIWKTPKSGKITAATLDLHYSALVNHRGSPPMPGEPMPGSTSTPAPSPSSEPTMLQALTAPAAPAPAPAPAPVAGSIDAMLAAIVDARVGARIEALEQELANRPAGTAGHHIKIGNAEPVALAKRPHAKLAHVLQRVQLRKPDGSRFNVLMVGDAGTGKSTIASNVAEALGLTFSAVNCSGGLTEGALVGRMTPNLTTGELVYSPGPLVEAYRNGGVFLLDEIDAADENVLLCLNAMIDATRWQAPNGEWIERHPDFILLAGANTYGTGASRIFSGRNQLDGAFLSRWLTATIDYDNDLERAMVRTVEIAERIQSARQRIRERGIRRWLTTREVLKADALVGQLSLTVREALLEVTEGWTAEDRSVAGIA